jgi:hypothetical protein
LNIVKGFLNKLKQTGDEFWSNKELRNELIEEWIEWTTTSNKMDDKTQKELISYLKSLR